MFFAPDALPICLSCLRKGQRVTETQVMAVLRVLNWAAGAVFLTSTLYLASALRVGGHSGGRSHMVTFIAAHPLAVLAASLSLLYLLMFFGTFILLSSAQEAVGDAPSTRSPSSSEQLRSLAAAEGVRRRHSSKAATTVPDHAEPAPATAPSPVAPATSSGRCGVFGALLFVVDWAFVGTVTCMVTALPFLSLYGLSLAVSEGAGQQWLTSIGVSVEVLPWALACVALAVLAARECGSRIALQRRFDTFASNATGPFTRSSSVSPAAIAGTNLMVEQDIERERLSTYVKQFPTGWYKLCNSEELVAGQVEYVRAVGLHLALFRGESGTVSALDAYCPHLGANMAIGGKVHGDCLECPFHKWQFDEAGAVASIPYSTSTPTKGAVRYPTMEYCGMVLVFYDADLVLHTDLSKATGQGACAEGAYPPRYLPPAIPDIDAGTMTFRGSFRARVVNMPLIEFVLNAVDAAHFGAIHSEMMVPWTPYVIPPPFNIITIDHETLWEPGADLGEASHLSHFRDQAFLKLFGKRLPYFWARAEVDTLLIGPGGLVRFQFTVPDMGRIVLFETHTPLDIMKLRTEFRYFADAAIPDVLVWYIVGNWVAQCVLAPGTCNHAQLPTHPSSSFRADGTRIWTCGRTSACWTSPCL